MIQDDEAIEAWAKECKRLTAALAEKEGEVERLQAIIDGDERPIEDIITENQRLQKKVGALTELEMAERSRRSAKKDSDVYGYFDAKVGDALAKLDAIEAKGH